MLIGFIALLCLRRRHRKSLKLSDHTDELDAGIDATRIELDVKHMQHELDLTERFEICSEPHTFELPLSISRGPRQQHLRRLLLFRPRLLQQ